MCWMYVIHMTSCNPHDLLHHTFWIILDVMQFMVVGNSNSLLSPLTAECPWTAPQETVHVSMEVNKLVIVLITSKLGYVIYLFSIDHSESNCKVAFWFCRSKRIYERLLELSSAESHSRILTMPAWLDYDTMIILFQ